MRSASTRFAYNNDSGITIGVSITESGLGNLITRNSIHGNKGLAIDLGGDGVTPNDPGDPDVGGSNEDGPNRLQNYPVLDTPTPLNATQFQVEGTLDSIVGEEFRIEFFASARPGDAKAYLGFVLVIADDGPTPFSFTYDRVPGSPFVTSQ